MKLDPRLVKFKEKMEASLVALDRDFSGIRTGRANPAIVENIRVEAYGNQMPVNQLANISVPDPRMISIGVWDAGITKAIADAILKSGLNLNPQIDGQNIKITLPPLTEERREELCKLAAKTAESTKVALRVVRRDAMTFIKNLETDGEITEDIAKRLNSEIQDLLNQFNGDVDQKLRTKQANIKEI